MLRPLTRAMLGSFVLLTAVACGSNSFELPTDNAGYSDNNDGAKAPAPIEPQDPQDRVLGTNPATDADFGTLPGGQKLSSISVSGTRLSLTKGTGTSFTATRKQEYLALRSATESDPNHKVQWALMDLDEHRVLAKSASSYKKLFGASSSKIYVGATLLDKQNGALTSSQLQLMANMLVVSSNEAWTNLQAQIGDGNSDKGRETIHGFTQRMGYIQTRGYQGYWGKTHGNELVPDEAVEMLYDTYRGAYPGAITLWKLMHTCRTGASRGLKYIPSNIYVGGKTGTYDGPTENPATGASYNVAIRNHLLVFYANGRQYGLAILSNSGSDESAALLAGGLIRDFGGIQ